MLHALPFIRTATQKAAAFHARPLLTIPPLAPVGLNSVMHGVMRRVSEFGDLGARRTVAKGSSSESSIFSAMDKAVKN